MSENQNFNSENQKDLDEYHRLNKELIDLLNANALSYDVKRAAQMADICSKKQDMEAEFKKKRN